MTYRAIRSRLVLLSAITGLILLQILVREPRGSLLWPLALDAGHAPLYGLVSLAMLKLLRRKDDKGDSGPMRPYLLALGLTVLVGIISELIQATGLGEASAGDVGRDALGAAAFLTVALTFDRSFSKTRFRLPRAAGLTLAALLFAPVLLPLAKTTIALNRRNAAFPKICGFEDSWEETFVSVKEATLELVPPPEGWKGASPGRVGCIEFQAGTYPGLAISHLHRDWSGYQKLVFEVYSELPEPVALAFRVHDIGHDNDYLDRFNRGIIIEQGLNRISIPLQEIRKAPQGREMDLTRVAGIVLFADHPSLPFALYLDDFRLE